MTLRDILEDLGIEYNDDFMDDVLDAEIEIHQQPSYPLKSEIRNVRILDGKLAIACSSASEYGSKEAWEDQ
jgi:hypothetical protein